jgi:hypothetical protein
MIVAIVALLVALSGASYAAVAINSVGAKQLKRNAVTAAKIKKNAVTGAKVRDGSLAGVDLGDGSVTGVDLGDGSVTGADLGDGSVGGADLQDGSVGQPDLAMGSVNGSTVEDRSLTGADVRDESLGSSDISGLGAGDVRPGTFLGGTVTVQYEIAASPLADGTSASYDVTCPAGETAIGGGARGDTTDSEYTVVSSSRPLQAGGAFPVDGQSFIGWRATVVNPTGATAGFPSSPPDGPILPEVWVICAKTA